MTSSLFTPFKMKSLDLPNRIVMAPMTRSKSPNGVPGNDVADYYARRAENEVSLILTEGTTIRRGGASNDPNVPNFHEADSLAGWKNVVEKVHAKGGKIAPQIWHMGMVRKAGSGPYPDAPTDSPSGMTHTGKAVIEATEKRLPMVAQTEISDAESGMRAVVEYPVKTMNYHPKRNRFQVDTGPVMWPDFSVLSEQWIECFCLAYVIYNRFDRADFIVRRQTAVTIDGKEVCQVLHYAEIHQQEAKHTIFCGNRAE